MAVDDCWLVGDCFSMECDRGISRATPATFEDLEI